MVEEKGALGNMSPGGSARRAPLQRFRKEENAEEGGGAEPLGHYRLGGS